MSWPSELASAVSILMLWAFALMLHWRISRLEKRTETEL
jgi:hypothetical protein